MSALETVILATDLEQIRRTLGIVENYFEAFDLAEQYRKLDTRGRRSSLAVQVETSLLKVDAYLEALEEPEEEDDDAVS